jgi:formiminoglutamate deiminase
MYAFLDRLDPDDVEAIAAQTFMEMLETGFTRVGEFHYLHHAPDGRPYGNIAELAGRIAAAAAATGIGLTLLPVFYAHGDFGGRPPVPGQRRFITDLDGFARLVEGCRSAVSGLEGAVLGTAPHSLRAVAPEELAALEAAYPHGPFHIHVSEQTREVEDCLAWSGQRPVAWLLDHAAVDERWCLIHATHADATERAGIASRGAVAGLCPITEASLGDGIFDAAHFQQLGGRWGLGSDSDILISAAEEMRSQEYAQRLSRRGRNLLAGQPESSTGRALFEAALTGGAQALGQDGVGLAPGAPADLCTLDSDHSVLVGRTGDELLDSWIFAARDRAIDTVWRAGRKQVSAGRHTQRDPIEARYRNTMRKLLA